MIFNLEFVKMTTVILSLTTGHSEFSDLSSTIENENIFSSSILEQLLPRCNLQLQCVRSIDIAGLLK